MLVDPDEDVVEVFKVVAVVDEPEPEPVPVDDVPVYVLLIAPTLMLE